jgi:hypothetical protein
VWEGLAEEGRAYHKLPSGGTCETFHGTSCSCQFQGLISGNHFSAQFS